MPNLMINDPAEVNSFLFPAYGFPQAEMAKQYCDAAYAGHRLIAPQIFTGQFRNAPTYVMIPGLWMSSLGTSLLTESVPSRHNQNGMTQRWEILRSVERAKPSSDSYLVGIMVEGRREYYRHSSDKRNILEWVKRLNSGPRDCFAAWSHRKGTRFRMVSCFTDEQNRMKNLFVSRSGCGAIYAETAVFDNQGTPIGNEIRLLLIAFSIFDKNPKRDDCLRLTLVRQSHWRADQRIEEMTFQKFADMEALSDLHPCWKDLAEVARRGFKKDCQPVNQTVEKYREFMIRQIALKELDECKPCGERFRERIEMMDWQKAIRACQEPWQFEVVIDQFSDHPQFSPSPDHSGDRGSRVANMINTFQDTPERLEQLQHWVRDFVAPRDNLWNDTGD